MNSIGNEDRQVELERIRKKHGRLTPTIVLEEAEPEGSVLHGDFEWDDTKAARAFRIDQARDLIQSVVIYRPRSKKTIRAYVSVARDRGDVGYRRIDDVMSDSELRAEMIRDFAGSLRSTLSRFAALEREPETASVFDVVADLSARLDGESAGRGAAG